MVHLYISLGNAKFSTHKPRCGITVEDVIFLPYGAIVEAINIRDGIFYQPTFMVEAVVSLSSLFVEIEGCCDFTNSPEALQLAHLVDFNLSTQIDPESTRTSTQFAYGGSAITILRDLTPSS